MIKENIDYKVKGYYGTWSVIDEAKNCCLLENNQYGDETCYLLVKNNAPVEDKTYTNKNTGVKTVRPTIMEVVGETYDDIETACDDYDI